MPVFETYASRVAAAAKVGTPDVYTYDELPSLLRKQISKIFTECIGPGSPRWDATSYIMDKEIESYSITNNYDSYSDCITYLRTSYDVKGVLSLIEICAQEMAELSDSSGLLYSRGATADPAEGIVELNQRFLRAGVGYQHLDQFIYIHASSPDNLDANALRHIA